MKNLLLVCSGLFLSWLVWFAVKRWRHNPDLTLDEIRLRMLPVDRELLVEIEQDSHEWADMRKDYSLRRDVRSALDDVKEQFGRICVVVQRIRDCASYYRSISEQQLCEEPLEDQEPEAALDLHARSEAIKKTIEATGDLRPILRRAMVRIWIADMGVFHKRQWGPVPDLAKLRILEVLEAYERVKVAAVNLAQAYGEGAISQQLVETM